MVAFRRLFLAEKHPTTDTGFGAKGLGGSEIGLNTTVTSPPDPRPSESNHPPSPRTKQPPTESQLEVDRHFDRIEKQLQEMHDSLRTRPACRSQLRSRGGQHANRNPRHVDILDAVLLKRNDNQEQTPDQSALLRPYNEDVAKRNMTQLQQKCPRKPSLYTRFISALHQEDGVDAKSPGEDGKKGTRSRSRSTTTRPANVSKGSAFSPKTSGDSSDHSGLKAKDSKQTETSAQEVFQPKSRDEPVTSLSDARLHDAARPRSQRSAPNLKSENPRPQKAVDSSPNLMVPPAHKQGDVWSNMALPDSPTLPTPVTREGTSPKDHGTPPRTPSSPQQRSPSATRNYSLPGRPAPSRKNTRNLSINTDLATKPAKVSHHAIQPPTPSSLDATYNPSIAEVMNSPLPSTTPTSISPTVSSNTTKVAEVMDMFRQASYSSAKPTSPHPTFETLQDAIVREINSHEAFQCVPVPGSGPAFTPSPSQESFDRGPRTNSAKPSKPSISGSSDKNGAGKESQLFKLIKPKKHRRNSEARRSISTSVPSQVTVRGPNSNTPGNASHRRHTDAPPPSPGFLDDPPPIPREPVPPLPTHYSDLPLRSQTASPGATTSKPRSISISRNPEHNNASVYYMRAQTSASSSDGRTPSFTLSGSGSGSGSGSDDDDVLQLPSPTSSPLLPNRPLRYQIPGLLDADRKDFKFVSDQNTLAGNAFRLVNWQQPAAGSRAGSRAGARSAAAEGSGMGPSPCSSSNGGGQQWAATSVESY